MATLFFRFPGGRYHATPWGHHVNEGKVEWPPSPWRLLRALIACGFATQGWNEVPAPARRLIESLSGTLPTYRLPPTSAAHSRHYMPLGALDKGREKTSLVFDTWANVDAGVMAIRWDCVLGDEERALLAQLAEHLGYLGRSESWVEAQMVATDAPLPDGSDAYPHLDGHNPGPDWEQVSLMAAVTPASYAGWREESTESMLADFPLPEGKKKPTNKLLKDRARVVAPYPEDLLDCLQKDTAWWKQFRWSQPPGSRQVLYWRRRDVLQVGVPRRRRRPSAKPVEMLLLALTTPSGNQSALPPCVRTLPQAELFHRSVVGRVATGQRVRCPELTGRDDNGEPLRNGHRHAHILPLDFDTDGHIDHILIYAPMGMGHQAQSAIRNLKRTWMKGGVGELQVALAGSGDLAALRFLPAPFDRQIEQLLGPPSGSRIWVSVTPFVPPRYLKRQGPNDLVGQINSELESRGFPIVELVELLPLTPDTLRLRHFVRRRSRGGQQPPMDIGLALRLHFAEAICGPLTLGYASHFGLGRFAAETNAIDS